MFFWRGGGEGEGEGETSSQELLSISIKCINYFKTHVQIIILLLGFCLPTKVIHRPIKPTQPTWGIWLDPKLKIDRTSDCDGQWQVYHKNSSGRSSGRILQNLTYSIRQTNEAKYGRDQPNPTIFLPYPTRSQQDLATSHQDLATSHQKSFGLLGIYLSLQS